MEKLSQKLILESVQKGERFTTNELAKKLNSPKSRICNMVYDMCRNGKLRKVGTRNQGAALNYGLENIYEKAIEEEVRVPQGYITPFPLVPIRE